MTTRVYDRTGRLIHRSRNLRGLLAHARRVEPIEVDVTESFRGDYLVAVRFNDDSCALSVWADWRVTADWLKARRSWPTLAVAAGAFAPFAARMAGGR